MADARQSFGTNLQENRAPAPKHMSDPGYTGSQQYTGGPPKPGMSHGPPGPPPGMQGPPVAPIPSGMTRPTGPPMSGPMPPVMGATSHSMQPVNGFSAPPMQPPPSSVTRTPGPPTSGTTGLPPLSSSRSFGVSQGQMVNGPSAPPSVNGMPQAGPRFIPPIVSQSQGFPSAPGTQLPVGGTPPLGGPPSIVGPPGPVQPSQGAGHVQYSGPPRHPGPGQPSQGTRPPPQGGPPLRPAGPGQPAQVTGPPQHGSPLRPPGPGQQGRPPGQPSQVTGPPQHGGPPLRPPGPGQPAQVTGPPQQSGPPPRPPGHVTGPLQHGSPPLGPPQHSGPPLRPPGPGKPGQGTGPPQLGGPPVMSGSGQLPQVDASRPSELPIPFQGHAQYSHQVGPTMKLTPGLTPSHSDPPSQRSSRAPSPIAAQSYDLMEGQFPASPPGSGGPPASTQGGVTAATQDATRTRITGRRQYPQMPANTIPPPGSQGFQGQPQAGLQPGFQQGDPSGGPQGFQQPGQPVQGFQQPGQPGQGFQQPGQPGQGFQQPGQPGQRFQQPGQGFQQPGQPGQGFQQPGQPGPAQGFQQGGSRGPQPPVSQAGSGSRPQQQSQGGQYIPQPGSQQNKPVGYNTPNPLTDFNNMNINDSSTRFLNLLQERHLIPSDGLETAKPNLQYDFKKANCNPDIFRCTLNAIPQTSALLNKARLPLGILIHPFKDLSQESEEGQLPVIQSSVIVRCRSCRTYINPFVSFIDQRRWKCNLCYRVNDLPDEFSFDPVSKTYGDPQRRPEVRSATIEFIAPSEYMLRPPQPSVYVFLLDVSFNAIETGYLQLFCQILLDELDKLPGDSRTQIAFLAYDRFLYFFGLAEGQSQPQMMVVPDLEDIFLPCPDNLLVNLQESKDLVIDLISQLPSLFKDNRETGSSLGAALQAAFKLTSGTGGRVTVMQTVLPTVGPGALQIRETPANASAKNVPHLGPATDFYKKMALDCSAQQVSVDLFLLNGQYADLASLTCVSKYSAGCIYYYPAFHTLKTPGLADRFDADLRRYLTRKIGFEAVMRIRCTRGLSIHTFHGNFFVRSTDLLSLPNINPDAGFGMQMSIEDSLTDVNTVCFQAALLYTSSKGERRIRVHTLCLPVTTQLSDVYATADQQAIICLLAKMAVDRSLTSSMGDARDALMNAAIDSITAYSQQITSSQRMGAIPLPFTLRVVPLFIHAMLKSRAFRSSNVRLDDRVFSLQQCKALPLAYLLQSFYPHLYPVHAIEDRNTITRSGLTIPKPPLLQLSSANIDRHGVYLMDVGNDLYLLVGGAVSDTFCQDVLDKPNFMAIPEGMNDLPELENPSSERLRNFVNYLMDSRPYGASFLVLREDSKEKHLFFQHMVEDKSESSMSYYEFLQYLQERTKS